MLRRTAIAAVLVLGLIAPEMAHAQRRGGGETVGPQAAREQQAARRDVQEGRIIPLPQLLAALNRRTPGRQLDAIPDRMGDRQVYRVPWVTNDGRRIDYVIDAQTGAILSHKGG